MPKSVDLPWRLAKPFNHIGSREEFVELTKQGVVNGCLFQPSLLGPDDAHGSIRIENVSFENVSFAKTEIKRLRFSKCKFTNCLFIGTILSECDFYRCEFKLCNFYKVRLIETNLDPKSIHDCLDKNQHTNIGLHLYSELRKSALRIENPEFASEAGYQYHRWNRYHLAYKHREGSLHSHEFALRWVMNIVSDYVIGYGWKIRRFALSTLVLLVLLTAWNFFFWSHLKGDELVFGAPSIIKSLYYTVLTITTLGYGDLTPTTPLGMLSSTGQTAIGVVWIGMLVSIVVRKVLS